MTARRGQWLLKFFLFMFACVMDLMVAVLINICHPFDSIKEIALVGILLICTSATIVGLGDGIFGIS
jgi:hypothetical protein